MSWTDPIFWPVLCRALTITQPVARDIRFVPARVARRYAAMQASDLPADIIHRGRAECARQRLKAETVIADEHILHSGLPFYVIGEKPAVRLLMGSDRAAVNGVVGSQADL